MQTHYWGTVYNTQVVNLKYENEKWQIFNPSLFHIMSDVKYHILSMANTITSNVDNVVLREYKLSPYPSSGKYYINSSIDINTSVAVLI